MVTCSFLGCDRERFSSKTQLCRAHREQQCRGETLRPIETRDGTPPPRCSFPGCLSLCVSRGLCGGHRRQRDADRSLKPLRLRTQCPSCPHPANIACRFPGCRWLARTHGLCNSHGFQRDKGRPLTALPIKAPKGARTKLEQRRLRQHERRIRLATSDVRKVTAKDWRRLIARYDGLCAYCRTRPATDQDHIVPVSRGGRYAIGNLLPACRSCNASKNGRLLVEWRRPDHGR